MNILKQSLLAIALMPLMANAITPVGKQVTGAIALQGGSDSSVKYTAPATSAYKVHVFVPKTGTATNALYRVYPKGKRMGSTTCVSSDSKFPCYEATIDQTLSPNSWTQLTLNSDPTTQWDFVKGKGYVTAVASNLSAVEMLNLSALVRFENQTIVIGKTWQGGIIFYVDKSGEHGLIAAPKDLTDSSGNAAYIEWWNGSYTNTGAKATAVGTGQANTTAIVVSSQGADSYAAKLCDDLVIGKYSDWYLPSKDELNLMYNNIGQGATTPLTNIGKFASYYYWSSSEDTGINGWGNAWGQDFDHGSQVYFSVNNTVFVRAIRSF